MRNTSKFDSAQKAAHLKSWKNASKLVAALSAIARNDSEQNAISTVLSIGDDIIAQEKAGLKAIADDAHFTKENAKRVHRESVAAHKNLTTKKADPKKVTEAAAAVKTAEKLVAATEAAHAEALDAHDEAVKL